MNHASLFLISQFINSFIVAILSLLLASISTYLSFHLPSRHRHQSLAQGSNDSDVLNGIPKKKLDALRNLFSAADDDGSGSIGAEELCVH